MGGGQWILTRPSISNPPPPFNLILCGVGLLLLFDLVDLAFFLSYHRNVSVKTKTQKRKYFPVFTLIPNKLKNIIKIISAFSLVLTIVLQRNIYQEALIKPIFNRKHGCLSKLRRSKYQAHLQHLRETNTYKGKIKTTSKCST